VLLLLACARAVLQNPDKETARKDRETRGQGDKEISATTGDKSVSLSPCLPVSFSASVPVSWSEYVRWVVLAFVPSSLMLGVTTYITLDIAAIPLLWVIPLALYLLSFIIVFAKWPRVLHQAVGIVLPLVLLVLVFIVLSKITKWPIVASIGLHLLMLFLV